jgi:hypothetical protein
MSSKNDGSTDQISGKWNKKSVSGRVVDPTTPLPGAMKRVGGNLAITESSGKKDQKELLKKFKVYAKQLSLNGGNQINALMAAYGTSEQEAEANQIKLHDDLMKAARGLTTSEIMKMNDVDKNARIMLLKTHMYSPEPGPSIASIKLLHEIDVASRGADESWETWVSSAIAAKRGKV